MVPMAPKVLHVTVKAQCLLQVLPGLLLQSAHSLYLLLQKTEIISMICAFWVATRSSRLTEPGVSKLINVLHCKGQGFIELVRLLGP